MNDVVVEPVSSRRGSDYLAIRRQRNRRSDRQEQHEEEEWEDFKELMRWFGIGDGRLLNYEAKIKLGLSLNVDYFLFSLL